MSVKGCECVPIETLFIETLKFGCHSFHISHHITLAYSPETILALGLGKQVLGQIWPVGHGADDIPCFVV